MPPRVKCMAHCCQRVPGYDTRIQSGVTALVNASFPAALPPPPPLRAMARPPREAHPVSLKVCGLALQPPAASPSVPPPLDSIPWLVPMLAEEWDEPR